MKSLNALGVTDVGPATTANLYKAGFTNIKLLYEASPTDFEKRVERVGAKSAIKIYEGLRAGKDTWSELSFMLASNKFPLLVGKTKLKLLLDIWPNVEEWDYSIITANRPAGISNDTIAEIINALPSYFEWYDANIKDILVIPGEMEQVNHEQRPVAAEGAQAAVAVGVAPNAQRQAVAAANAPPAQRLVPAVPNPQRPAVGTRKDITIVLTGFRDKSLEEKYNVQEMLQNPLTMWYIEEH